MCAGASRDVFRVGHGRQGVLRLFPLHPDRSYRAFFLILAT